MSSRLNDKYKSVFRLFIITLLDKSVNLEKNKSIFCVYVINTNKNSYYRICLRIINILIRINYIRKVMIKLTIIV